MPKVFGLMRDSEIEEFNDALLAALEIAEGDGVDVGELLEKSTEDAHIDNLRIEMWALRMYEQFLRLRRAGRL